MSPIVAQNHRRRSTGARDKETADVEQQKNLRNLGTTANDWPNIEAFRSTHI